MSNLNELLPKTSETPIQKEETPIKKEETPNEKAEEALNKSILRQNIMCNHCRFKCENYEKMKEHYSSDFHKYNLNRVTLNFAPILYEEYIAKKQAYLKKEEEKRKQKEKEQKQNEQNVLYCTTCFKKFTTRVKLEEHYKSKAHLKKEAELKAKKEKAKDNNQEEEEISTKKKEKNPLEKEKTTIDDKTICLFCNMKNESIEKNFFHMIDIHKLDIPFLFCIKNFKGLIYLLAQKIFNYGACLFCDTQKFENYKSLQAHMLDKGHTHINDSDLDEHLYKYYDKNKLRSLKDAKWTKMREYKILSLRLKVAEKLKEKKKDKEEDDWEEEESDEEEKKEDKKDYKEDDSDDDDFDPLVLPNGELLLENGTVLGNKIYNLYYKQRIKLSRLEDLENEISNIKANKRIVRKKLIKKKNINMGRRRRRNNGDDLKGKSGYQYLRLR